MTRTPVNRIWPLPLRKLTAEVIRDLSVDEFYLLCRLVYRRARNRQHERHARALVRRLIVRRQKLAKLPPRRELHPNMLLARFRDDTILEGLYPNRKKHWISPVQRRDTIQLDLRKFSFVDAPNETMRQLHAIAAAECTARVGSLDFSDTQILDIGPYVVWGLMSRAMAPFLLGGAMDIAVQKVIEAVELRRFMRMDRFKGLRDHKDVWAFPLRQRNPGTPTAIPAQAIGFSKVADELVETVDEWLGALPVAMELTEEARGQLNRITTEMLDNAERHSRPGDEIGDWYVAGFMARREGSYENGKGRDWYDCHIAIVNLGRTIAQNILDSAEQEIRNDLERYIARHRSKRGRSREMLATLYAMQDGVSSLPKGAGGQGMMEMVELVNELGGTDDPEHQPAITILSGRSCIRFSDAYKGYLPSTPHGGRRVQPFNAQGTFEFPPDANYIFDLDFDFPGTIVALRFSLDYEALMQRADQK